MRRRRSLDGPARALSIARRAASARPWAPIHEDVHVLTHEPAGGREDEDRDERAAAESPPGTRPGRPGARRAPRSSRRGRRRSGTRSRRSAGLGLGGARPERSTGPRRRRSRRRPPVTPTRWRPPPPSRRRADGARRGHQERRENEDDASASARGAPPCRGRTGGSGPPAGRRRRPRKGQERRHESVPECAPRRGDRGCRWPGRPELERDQADSSGDGDKGDRRWGLTTRLTLVGAAGSSRHRRDLDRVCPHCGKSFDAGSSAARAQPRLQVPALPALRRLLPADEQDRVEPSVGPATRSL